MLGHLDPDNNSREHADAADTATRNATANSSSAKNASSASNSSKNPPQITAGNNSDEDLDEDIAEVVVISSSPNAPAARTRKPIAKTSANTASSAGNTNQNKSSVAVGIHQRRNGLESGPMILLKIQESHFLCHLFSLFCSFGSSPSLSPLLRKRKPRIRHCYLVRRSWRTFSRRTTRLALLHLKIQLLLRRPTQRTRLQPPKRILRRQLRLTRKVCVSRNSALVSLLTAS